ncbi:unnamed protein product [Camellia sinensis]
MSDRCKRQFTGSCRTVVEDSLRGHVGPMYRTVYGVMSDRCRSCGGAPRRRLRECAMSDLYMILV